MRRRTWLAGATAALTATSARAAPSTQVLQNRIELWANYARRTKNVLARLVTTRETSLLSEPLVVTGTMAFEAPGTLVLRDDGLTGSSTLVDSDGVFVVPNQTDLALPPGMSAAQRPAQAWLADRLLRLFRPPDGETGERAVIEDARVDVPRKSYRLELMPPSGSIVRRTFRSITVHLDPVVGAVTQILIAQTQGDRLRLQLSDHRQNVDAGDIDALVTTVRSRIDAPRTQPESP